MILQSLVDYYRRKCSDPDSTIAQEGFERKAMSFVIILDKTGRFVDIQDMRETNGKNRRGRSCIVPAAVKRSVNIEANFLWDDIKYLFGFDPKGNDEARAQRCHEAFKKKIRDVCPQGVDIGTDAISRFLEERHFEELYAHPHWPEILKSNGNVTFRLENDSELICERNKVIEAWLQSNSQQGTDEALCLITGKLASIARLHTAIKGVRNAQSSGANIVSFNQESFASFGKEQGRNAPCCQEAVFAYTTALNTLLAKGSRQNLLVGDATTVFWAAKANSMEQSFAGFFNIDEKDDPDRRSQAVRNLYRSPYTGVSPDWDDNTSFNVLGLAPNNSRIAIRFWHSLPIKELTYNLRSHFADLEMDHGPKESDTLPLFQLLVATAVQGKADNIVPNLSGEVFNSIILGLPYPRVLLQALLSRIRAEQTEKYNITYPRAALLKAWLNRWSRKKQLQEKELTVTLDKTNKNIGYCLGRLFAALERIQEQANPGINATIRHRFYGAASMRPATVFGNLMRLKNHHLKKLEYSGFFECILGEIMESVCEFPPLLNLFDQGRFAVGYYHQRQDFFKKKEDNEKGDNKCL